MLGIVQKKLSRGRGDACGYSFFFFPQIGRRDGGREECTIQLPILRGKKKNVSEREEVGYEYHHTCIVLVSSAAYKYCTRTCMVYKYAYRTFIFILFFLLETKFRSAAELVRTTPRLVRSTTVAFTVQVHTCIRRVQSNMTNSLDIILCTKLDEKNSASTVTIFSDLRYDFSVCPSLLRTQATYSCPRAIRTNDTPARAHHGSWSAGEAMAEMETTT